MSAAGGEEEQTHSGKGAQTLSSLWLQTFVTGKFNFTKQPLLLACHLTSQLLEEANKTFLLGATESLFMPVLYHTISLRAPPTASRVPKQTRRYCIQYMAWSVSSKKAQLGPASHSCQHMVPDRYRKSPVCTEAFSSSPLQQLEAGVSPKTRV